MRLLGICACAMAMLPAVAGAQQTARNLKGPTIQSAAVGFRVDASKVDASTKVTAGPMVMRHQGQDVALMAVGVGAIIIGAFVPNPAGAIIIVGGAAMALFGLYHYLE